jgi:5-methyltetrahydrofolate--homocysteine methyltransferase
MNTTSNVSILSDLPVPTDTIRHIRTDYKLEDVWEWIGPKMFYNKILGYRGPFIKDLENKVQKAIKLYEDVENVKQFVLEQENGLMSPKAVYQFFKCRREGDSIFILDSDKETSVLESFIFPRQQKREKLCLSDYVHPEGDYIALFANTSGNLVNETAENLRDQDKFKNSFILQALGLATAEALAEVVHKEIRTIWGIIDDDKLSKDDIYLGKYRGLRYSFGYPACPNLEDQEKLWKLLNPEEIGIELTDGFMMDPEASVSAIVFHHPEAKYFSV